MFGLGLIDTRNVWTRQQEGRGHSSHGIAKERTFVGNNFAVTSIVDHKPPSSLHSIPSKIPFRVTNATNDNNNTNDHTSDFGRRQLTHHRLQMMRGLPPADRMLEYWQ